MNELFAADPAVCGRASELKLLLGAFGPYTGRYLANFPSNWAKQVERQFEGVGETEVARAKTLLRRASESGVLFNRAKLAWNTEREWMANAERLLATTPPTFEGLIATRPKPPAIHHLDELDLPPTADERIAGTASEYARISKNLVLISSEIVLVDPYLNPLKRDCQAVLEALFLIAAQGRNQKIILWTRAAEVYGPGSNESTESTESDIRDLLFRLARRTKFKPGSEIHMNFVEDEARRTKMHARYLLSIKGGIRFDQGFQQLPQGRRVDVGPIGKATHDELFDIYFEGRHDMSVVQRITLKI